MAASTPRAPEYWLLKFPAATDRPPPFASGMPAGENGAGHGPALRVMKYFDQKAAGDNSQLVDGLGAWSDRIGRYTFHEIRLDS